MAETKIKLRGFVLTWTILTTTFFWTSTMRILMKPEISSWSVFGAGGKGFLGEFWLPPLIAMLALFMFYLEGRGKIRPIYHILLLAWHLLITGGIIYGSLQGDGDISFGTWGISVAFEWLVAPFALFLVLAVILVIRESIGAIPVPDYGWHEINRNPLLLALALLPIAVIFFYLGTGFNWLTKIAVASTIVQWIFLAESLGRPYMKKRRNGVR